MSMGTEMTNRNQYGFRDKDFHGESPGYQSRMHHGGDNDQSTLYHGVSSTSALSGSSEGKCMLLYVCLIILSKNTYFT